VHLEVLETALGLAFIGKQQAMTGKGRIQTGPLPRGARDQISNGSPRDRISATCPCTWELNFPLNPGTLADVSCRDKWRPAGSAPRRATHLAL
jgi:hypothetical protein